MSGPKHRKRRKPQVRVLEDHAHPMLEVAAGSWRGLLEGAAQGLATLLQEPQLARPQEEQAQGNRTPGTQMFPVELHRIDFDAILTAWLDELLHLAYTQRLLPERVEILQLDLEADCKLTATVEGTQQAPAWRPQLASVAAPQPRSKRTSQGLTCRIAFLPRTDTEIPS